MQHSAPSDPCGSPGGRGNVQLCRQGPGWKVGDLNIFIDIIYSILFSLCLQDFLGRVSDYDQPTSAAQAAHPPQGDAGKDIAQWQLDG